METQNQQYFVGEKVEGNRNHPQLEDEPQIGGAGFFELQHRNIHRF